MSFVMEHVFDYNMFLWLEIALKTRDRPPPLLLPQEIMRYMILKN